MGSSIKLIAVEEAIHLLNLDGKSEHMLSAPGDVTASVLADSFVKDAATHRCERMDAAAAVM